MIDEAIASLAQLPKDERSLARSRAFVGNADPGGIGARLARWRQAGRSAGCSTTRWTRSRSARRPRLRHDPLPGQPGNPHAADDVPVPPPGDLVDGRRLSSTSTSSGRRWATRLSAASRRTAQDLPQAERLHGVRHPVAARRAALADRPHHPRAVRDQGVPAEPTGQCRGLRRRLRAHEQRVRADLRGHDQREPAFPGEAGPQLGRGRARPQWPRRRAGRSVRPHRGA